MCEGYRTPLRTQVSEPLLRLHGMASVVAEGAIVAYYTRSPFHVETLERNLEELERRAAAFRGALEAIRSRSEDPLVRPAGVS